MSESNLPVQVQDGQKFDSLATFELAMIRWAVNKISKTDKMRTAYTHAKFSFYLPA
jgi:hypothetical protein